MYCMFVLTPSTQCMHYLINQQSYKHVIVHTFTHTHTSLIAIRSALPIPISHPYHRLLCVYTYVRGMQYKFVCVMAASINVLSLSLSLSPSLSPSTGLQLHSGCHGDFAQYRSGHLVYSFFYLNSLVSDGSPSSCLSLRGRTDGRMDRQVLRAGRSDADRDNIHTHTCAVGHTQ